MSKHILTVEQAMDLLKPGEYVHCFRTPAPAMLIGADWKRSEVEAHFRKHAPELAGPAATGMGHGVSAGGAFFETQAETQAETLAEREKEAKP